MNEDIRSLIESLRRGQYDDPDEKIGLLAAALLEHQAEDALVESLLQAPQVPLRLAALRVCRDRPAPGLLPSLLRLVRDPDERVRCRLAEALGVLAPDLMRDALESLSRDSEDEVRVAVLKATAGRPEFLELHRDRLLNDAEWEVRLAAVETLDAAGGLALLGDLVSAVAKDDDSDVQFACADRVERALVQDAAGVQSRLPTDAALLARVERNLSFHGERFPRFQGWVRGVTREVVNPAALTRFGTDLTEQALAGSLSRGYRVDGVIRSLLERFALERVRSVALIGRSGVGKSSVVHELVHALSKAENGAWRVLRMSPTDFMAGTRYLGEWETKVRELVETIRRPRRILLYIPNLSDLATVGRWSKSDTNVASALAPYIQDGSIVVLGESTPEEYERGLGGDLALSRLFERVLVEESSREETRAILAAIRDAAGVDMSDAVLGELQEASEYFFGHQCRPGNAATLLRAVIDGTRDLGRPITRRDVLDVLSKSTGVPAGLLDDVVPLDLAELRAFFEQRIIGQPEAVSAMVDTVTLIKAGLTDPQKPFGVMLFVGPTGVGKTELARALAEYIFGDPARLLRFDMSEFASPDGFTRLIGGRGENGLLTDAVRQRPFSVILLDEIEKSHINVFDLCLQIFDAGRLTDGRGQLVDFRRSIVILTSNVGAQVPGAPLGFGRTVEAPGADPDRTFRELARVFRPEFLNRIDRIVNFLPLSVETAERIARKELDLVLQRSGIARRGLSVQVDPALISLLVRLGYSPHFGARPLKRTVERLVLVPLARAIATGRAVMGNLLTLRAEGDTVNVRLVPTSEPEDDRVVPSGGSAAAPGGGTRRLRVLRERLGGLESGPWPPAGLRSELVDRTNQPGFYQDATLRVSTFDELNRLDQFLERRQRLREAVDRLVRVSGMPGRSAPAESEDRLAELESELEQIEFIARHPSARELSDVYVFLSRTACRGDAINAVELLAGMYCGMARRRHFQASIVAERRDDRDDVAVVQILGLGAAALVAGEVGLHEFNRRMRVKNPRSGREQTHEDSAMLRVSVVPVGADPEPKFAAQTGLKAVRLPDGAARLVEGAAWRVSGFHEPTIRSFDLWFAGERKAALEQAARLLFAQVSAPAAGPGEDILIRRYDLGIGSRIKDLRTGRTTSRLAQFFRGQVDLASPGDEASEPGAVISPA